MGNSIYRKIVFMPPVPTYTVTTPRKVEYFDMINTKVRKHSADLEKKDIDGCFQLPGYWFRAKTTDVKTTILYSHGNAADIGLMFELLERLHESLDVNIFHYDYLGYGITQSKYRNVNTTEDNVYQAAESALHYLVNKKGLNFSDIIVMGTSVGSGPTTHLAAKYGRLKGLILECPFASCMRVVLPFAVAKAFTLSDMFVNVDKIPKIKMKLLIFHGDKDSVVPIENSKLLWSRVPSSRKYRYIEVPNADHNDIFDVFGEKRFCGTIQRFIESCEEDLKERKKDFEKIRDEEIKSKDHVKRGDDAADWQDYDDDDEEERKEDWGYDDHYRKIFKYLE